MTSSMTETLAGARGSDPAVSLVGVTKDFGPVHAVRGIDLEIRPGEIVAFLGPNGAGKTTTIDMVLGLSRPTSGEVRPASSVARSRPVPPASS
jgi:ABC-2 type transport system ATP-binding protein